MDIQLVDVTIHVDETLPEEQREVLVDKVREHDGVVSVGNHADKPHLLVVEYNPDKVNSQEILGFVKNQGVHAELIGM
jgi:myo-inositol-hexaphosphate 3-phosphohydrolase